jgi:DNA topoisomerase-1
VKENSYSVKSELVFINGNENGIIRKKNRNKFIYLWKSKILKNNKEMERIQKLVIPPAWKEVWICKNKNGHLQATGIDIKGRKQYLYHPEWHKIRNKEKFDRLYQFGKILPKLRQNLNKDLMNKTLCQEKVLAAAIKLMEKTYVRVGNSFYEKENGSYGLTTLKDNHVAIKGDEIKLSFIGKKGVHQSISIHSKKLAKIVKACRDIPGKELFQYYDEAGNRHPIDSGKVNEYIKNISGSDFTAKDYRTWAGSLNMLRALREMHNNETGKINSKKKIVEALDYVSEKLGNTRSVCKKYYVHPKLISMYEDSSLLPYLSELNKSHSVKKAGLLKDEEKILMKILRHY